MKKLLFFLLILVVKFSAAQKTDTIPYSGIFLNYLDYKANKLTYSMNCDLPSGKIRLNHFFSKNYIDVINGDKKIQLYKDSIYGYRDCKQMDFRFYRKYDSEYQILENKSIVIYTALVPVTFTTGKTVQLVPAYYFSKTLDSDILPLTVINLKRVFPDNLKFHDKLDVEFYHVKEISSFDDVHKMYKVNYLLSQSNIN